MNVWARVFVEKAKKEEAIIAKEPNRFRRKRRPPIKSTQRTVREAMKKCVRSLPAEPPFSSLRSPPARETARTKRSDASAICLCRRVSPATARRCSLTTRSVLSRAMRVMYASGITSCAKRRTSLRCAGLCAR